MRIFRRLDIPLAGLYASACLLAQNPANATIVGPYTPDPDTLHLWHLDEAAVPAIDSIPSGTNLVGLLNTATLANPSFPGFGTALNTIGSGQDSTTQRGALLTASTAATPGNVSITVADPTSGAFTFEAIVWIGFDPTKNFGTTADGGNNRTTPFNILTGESTVNGNRIFQFRLVPAGLRPLGGSNPTTPVPLLTFENVRAISGNQPSIYAAIPTTGPDAIQSNSWYHVAISYTGVPSSGQQL